MAGDNKAKILRDAEKYVTSGKIPQAINEYLKIIKTDPHDVLTLNTIGDLYLRQGNVPEALRYFSGVAETYTRNNFLLKAIAVYKKMLMADPENVGINQTLAGLLARQGLHLDARNQYMRLAELLSKVGKSRESTEAYEKVVELDPMSSAVQTKLAQIYLAEGAHDKALSHFTGAARGQAKGGDYKAAAASYERAVEISPLDIAVLKGYLEACAHLREVSPVLERLRKSVDLAPDNLSLLELLGQAYLAAGDLENASKTFQRLLSQEENRYPLFFPLSSAYVQKGAYDQAALCLDPIIPILITKRETERAVEAYNLIVSAKKDHDLALSKLVEIFSATNDQLRQLSTLEKVVDLYLNTGRDQEALLKTEALLQMAPENEGYQSLHRQAFEKAFPGKDYSPPVISEEAQLTAAAGGRGKAGSGAQAEGTEASIIEIDLLLNYGMKEKALTLLQAMESQDPTDKEARIRLVTLYRDAGEPVKAAEQCLALAALYRNLHQEEHVTRFLSEARRLAPDLAGPRFDLAAFAAERGILIQSPGGTAEPADAEPAVPGMEVDLSEDLSEIFFKDSKIPAGSADIEEIHNTPRPIVEDFPTRIPHIPAAESVQEQLQEVDFYIRLGFSDEARTKLDELAKEFPDNPELNLRYQQLKGGTVEEAEPPIALGPVGPEEVKREEEESPALGGDLFHDLKIDLALEPFGENLLADREGIADAAEGPQDAASSQAERESLTGTGDGGVPGVGPPELLDEVEAISDEQIAEEDFETHFNLGIAYREMDLLDDAIREFQIAFKTLKAALSPKEVVRCCGMLSTCYLEKGIPRSTIRWCQTGLSVAEISKHEAMALRYDMGVAHHQVAEDGLAFECFSIIFGIDPSYRDVAQKIDSLRGRS